MSPAVDAIERTQTRSASEPTDTGEIVRPFSPEQPPSSAGKKAEIFRWTGLDAVPI
jgi:hypothetical protein